MVCGVKDCTNLAKYLRIVRIDKDRTIEFNVCEECNGLYWVEYKIKT